MSSIDIKIIRLCDRHLCTGCMACIGSCSKNAISIVKDEEGFPHPQIDNELCVRCQLCVNNCPVFKPISRHKKGDVYAAWSLDDSIRQRSSSGGLFSEFAIYILNLGGAVVGAAMNSDGYVFHRVVENNGELDELRGSKYVQSIILPDVLRQIQEILKQKRPLLFVGTPCQVAGMRKLFRDNDNLYTIDLICHGVPSPVYFSKIYKDIKQRYNHFVSYHFRMLDSWGAFGNIDIKKKDRVINQTIYGELSHYQDAFEKGYLNRLCCYECQYATIDRVGDITLADFWGIGAYKPIPNDHHKGCSLLLENSDKGKFLLERIKDRLYIEERSIQEAIDGGNVNLVKPRTKPSERNTFYGDAKLLSYVDIINKYKLTINKRPSLFKRVSNKINRIFTIK